MYAERYCSSLSPQRIVWIASTTFTFLRDLVSISHPSTYTESLSLAVILTLTFLAPIGPMTRISALRAQNTLSSIDATWGAAMVDRVLLWTLATAAFATTNPRQVEDCLRRGKGVVFRTDVEGWRELQRLLKLWLVMLTSGEG